MLDICGIIPIQKYIYKHLLFLKRAMKSDVKFSQEIAQLAKKTDDQFANIILEELTEREKAEIYQCEAGFMPYDFIHDLIGLRAYQMEMIFGKPTNTIASETGVIGCAKWTLPNPKNGMVIKEYPSLQPMWFLNELIVHDNPRFHDGHLDFLRTKMDGKWLYKEDNSSRISEISAYITMDDRDKTVTAGCCFLGANLVSHMIAIKAGMGLYRNTNVAEREYEKLIFAVHGEFERAPMVGAELLQPYHQTIISFLNEVYHDKEPKIHREHHGRVIAPKENPVVVLYKTETEVKKETTYKDYDDWTM